MKDLLVVSGGVLLFVVILASVALYAWGVRKRLSYEIPKSVANVLVRQREYFFIIVTYLIDREKSNFREFSKQIVEALNKSNSYGHIVGMLDVMSQMSEPGVVKQELLQKLIETLAVTTKEPHKLIKDAKESKEIGPLFIAACIEYLVLAYRDPKNRKLSGKADEVIKLFNLFQANKKTYIYNISNKFHVILGDKLDINAVLGSWFRLFQSVDGLINTGKSALNSSGGGSGISGLQQPHFLLAYFRSKWETVPGVESVSKLSKTDIASLSEVASGAKEEEAAGYSPVELLDAGECKDCKVLPHTVCPEIVQSAVSDNKDLKQDEELIVMNTHRVFVEEAFAHTIPDLCSYYHSVGKQIVFDCCKIDCSGHFLDVWALQQSSNEHGQPLHILISTRFVNAVLFATDDNKDAI